MQLASKSLSMPLISAAFAGFLTLLAFLFAFPVRFLSTDVGVPERGYAYLNESCSTLDVSCLQALAYLPFDGMLTKGNSKRKVVLKFVVKSTDQALVLTIQPPYYRQAEVFIPRDDGQFTRVPVGSVKPYNAYTLPTLNTTIPINFDLQNGMKKIRAGTLTVYTVLESETAAAAARVMPFNTAIQYDSALSLTIGLYVGLSVLVAFIAIVMWLATGERLWMDSLVGDVTAFFFSFMQFGVLHRYLPDHLQGDWVFKLYVFSQGLLALGFGYFYPKLYREFKVPEVLLGFFKIGMLIPIVSVICIVADRFDLALTTTNVYILATLIMSVAVFFKLKHDSKTLLLIIRAYLLVFCGVAGFWMLAITLKLPAPRHFALYSLAPSNLFSMMVILMLLGHRTQLKLQEKRELEIAEQQARASLELEKQRLQETSGFLSMVIHEVKNPLNYIRLAVQNLKYTIDSDSSMHESRFRHIIDSVTAIDDLLERSLQVDMIEQGNVALYVEPIDLVELMSLFLRDHPERERVELHFGSQAIFAQADRDVTRLVFRNLIDNALKYSPKGSVVRAEIFTDASHCFIQIANKPGPSGRPDETRLFKKYYHADEDRFVSGMGLGLYWVKEVIKKLNGGIDYAFINDEIRFKVWLPI